MLESINSALLANLTAHIKTGTDTQTILRRYQILAIIYVNAMCSLLCFLWNFISWVGFPLPAQGANLGVYPLVIISFVFLKLGFHELSAVSVVGYFHSTIYLLNKMSGASLASLTITIVCPASAFLFSSSAKIHACNIALSMVQHFILMMDINESFKATFTDDQRALVFQMQICSFMMIILLGLLSYIQKTIQTSLWQAAQMNYERAEKINKEVVQAIEAKDVFVSSLSHEIRNPLNALKGSIDYLFKVVKDPQFLQILENAKLSGEVLLNLVNNVLDAAKLKSDKMELAHIEMTSLDMVKKLIMIHVERLREKKISAQVYIYKNVPTIMWVDSSRLLQVVMNLFSNAIKFTPNNGNIKLFISWCKDIEKPENLLLPIQDQFQSPSMASFSTVEQEQHDQKLPLVTKTSMETERWYSSRSKEDNSSDPNTMLEFDQTEKMSHSRKMKTLKSFETRRLQELAFKDVKVFHKYLVWNIDSRKDIDIQELNSAYSLLTQDKSRVNKNGFLKVQISDNGCGIPPEHLPKMFEMFSQGGQNVGSVYGGSGLGLWLCKQICQKMGGDIELYTQPGKGTSFVFYVPVDNENLMAEPVYRTNSLRDKVRGLVVDDFSYNREIHKLLLEREGVQVNLANNGREAVERYKAQGNKFYDFIMMDVQMPEMDGFTAAKEIRNWEMENNWRKVDIYFVSGEYYNDREIMADLKAKGQLDETSGVRCLRKPIDVELVRKIVEKYFNRRKQSINLLSYLTASNEDIKKGGADKGGDSSNPKSSPMMTGIQNSAKKEN